jgi:hypothetical protein
MPLVLTTNHGWYQYCNFPNLTIHGSTVHLGDKRLFDPGSSVKEVLDDAVACYAYSATACGTGRTDAARDFSKLYKFPLPEIVRELDLQPFCEGQPTPKEYRTLGDLLAAFSGQPSPSHTHDVGYELMSGTKIYHYFDSCFCRVRPGGDVGTYRVCWER